jgi:hypothetical protein
MQAGPELPWFEETMPSFEKGAGEQLKKRVDEISTQLSNVSTDVRNLSTAVTALLDRGMWRWVIRHQKLLWSLVPVLSVISVWVVNGPLPRYRQMKEAYDNNRMDDRIAVKTKDQFKKLDEMSNDISVIKGQLQILAPLIESRVQKTITGGTKLNGTRLNMALPEIKTAAVAARSASIDLNPTVVANLGDKILGLQQSPGAWPTVLELMDYRSFFNTSLAPQLGQHPRTQLPLTELWMGYTIKPIHPGIPIPTPKVIAYGKGVPKSEAAVMEPIGQESQVPVQPLFMVVDATGWALNLSGQHLKNVIIENAEIHYEGGNLILEDVWFINCIFKME